MTGPRYFLRENGAQNGGHGFPLRLSTFQGSISEQQAAYIRRGEGFSNPG